MNASVLAVGRHRVTPETSLMPSFLIALAGALLVLWVVLVGLLWWQQDRLVFAGWGFGLVHASGLDPGDERIDLTMEDGVRLVGGLRQAGPSSRGLLLVFSGNAEDADWRLRHLGDWVRRFDIATFFYRGFGPSGGRPDQRAIVADAVRIHDLLVARLRPARVIVAEG